MDEGSIIVIILAPCFVFPATRNNPILIKSLKILAALFGPTFLTLENFLSEKKRSCVSLFANLDMSEYIANPTEHKLKLSFIIFRIR